MPTVGQTKFQWFQPNESQLNEVFGADESRAQAVVQIPGSKAARRLAALDLLEFPTYVVTPSGKKYISRHLPLAYPSPFLSGEVDDPNQLYAVRFAGGRGVGPRGQDAVDPARPNDVPLPLYQLYQYDVEFTDRTYDILPDSTPSLAAPGPLSPPLNVSVSANQSGGQLSDFSGGFNVAVTALSPYGETQAVLFPGNPVQIGNGVLTGSLSVSWGASPGTVGYKVYAKSVQGAAWQVVFNGAVASNSVVVLNLTGGVPAPLGPPVGTNTSASPLYDAAAGVGLPDEGAALAAADGRSGSRYVTRNSRPGGQGVTVPQSFLYFQDSGIPLPQGLLKVVPTETVVLTWHQVPRAGVPIQAIRNALGCVNAGPIDGWPPGTLLFDSMDPRRYRSALGGRVVDIQYTFTGKMNIDLNGVPQGHNSSLEYTGGRAAVAGQFGFGKPGKLDYVAVRSDVNGGGNPPFRSFDMTALFRPEQG